MVDCRGLLENEGYVCPHGASHGLSPHRKDSLSLVLLCGIKLFQTVYEGRWNYPRDYTPKDTGNNSGRFLPASGNSCARHDGV